MLEKNAVERLNGSSIFSADWYWGKNPDTRVMDAALHVIRHGHRENRPIFDPVALTKAISDTELIRYTPTSDVREIDIDIYISSQGNVFMREIAEDIAYCFNEAGSRASIKSEVDANVHDPKLKIVVAPHEFFKLNNGKIFLNAEFLSNCIVYNTEQIQTTWFASGLPAILMAKAVVDINNQNASILRQFDIPTLHWEPPARAFEAKSELMDHPLLKAMPACHSPIEWASRPVDVSFLGSHSAKREKALARIAPRISGLESFIYYRRRSNPLRDGEDALLSDVGGYAASVSKIYLNIHRDVMPFFEWHRIVKQGIANGALVITDPCLPHPDLKSGQNYLEVNTRHLGDAIEWVINDPSGKQFAETIIENNRALFSSNNAVQQSAETLTSFIRENCNV